MEHVGGGEGAANGMDGVLVVGAGVGAVRREAWVEERARWRA